MAGQRTIISVIGGFGINQRRKFTLKNANGKPLVDLYFRPITRSNRTRVQALAGSGVTLKVSTQMLCHMAGKKWKKSVW